MARLLVWALVLASLGSFSRAIVLASTTAPQASQDARNARFEVLTDELTRRLGVTERDISEMKPDVAVLKSDMAEVKWIARGAATGIVSLIIMTAFGIPVKRPTGRSESEA